MKKKKDYSFITARGTETEENYLEPFVAYCKCGDALERQDLYPAEARYYCMGCDVTYMLIEQKKE